MVAALPLEALLLSAVESNHSCQGQLMPWLSISKLENADAMNILP